MLISKFRANRKIITPIQKNYNECTLINYRDLKRALRQIEKSTTCHIAKYMPSILKQKSTRLRYCNNKELL